MSSRSKKLEENMESLNEEDENEHARLMKEQEDYEIQSMNKMPRHDDSEYARMIEMSENLGRGDAKMEDLEISDDEEEKQPHNNRKDSKERYQRSDRDEEEDGDEVEDDSQKSPGNQKSAFTSNSNLHKKQAFPTSSFLKRTAFTRDSESHDKYQTPQRYPDPALSVKSPSPSSRAHFTLRQDSNERFRQEVVQQVKVRVEELQSRMKSKSDMFYVMRHMCKKWSCLNRLRWVSFSRIRWLPDSVHEGYSNWDKKGMLASLYLDRARL